MARRAGGLVSKLGGMLAALLAVGPLLAWLRLVPGMVGFLLFVVGGLGSIVVAVIAIVQAARGRGLGRGGMAAVAGGILFMVLASLDAGAPPINDFTTDLADPPVYTHAAQLPPNRGRDLGYPPDFADVQRKCCSDLHAARLPVGAELAFARARDTASRMPAWTVTHSDQATGTIEAIATSRLFGFEDDIVIRVREVSPQISQIDVRSKSRDGRGDLGANAARIRAYVAALERGPGGPVP